MRYGRHHPVTPANAAMSGWQEGFFITAQSVECKDDAILSFHCSEDVHERVFHPTMLTEHVQHLNADSSLMTPVTNKATTVRRLHSYGGFRPAYPVL